MPITDSRPRAATPYFTQRTAGSACPIYLHTPSSLATWSKSQPATVRQWIAAHAFEAAPASMLALPDSKGALHGVIAGVDTSPNLWSIAHLPALLPAGTYRLVSAWKPSTLSDAALGFALAQYQFDRYKTVRRKRLVLQLPSTVDSEALHATVAAITRVRDLINLPPNDLGPADLARHAQAIAKQCGAQFHEIVGDALLAKNYPLIHAVGRAGSQAPRLITLTHGKLKDPLVVLVGKGVTFDTGGLDVKPYSAMKLMKKDMGGAALVLGLMQRIIAAKLPIRLKMLIPAVENSIASNAFRPQDILPSRKGLTVEIGSPDAEGRLILADALADGDADKPALMIDVATLTGAARTALGTDLPALYTNRDALAQEITRLSHTIADPFWPMPLWQGYARHVNSTIADVTNSPNYGFAGSITAALFLERFISPATPWVHLDTYAWNAESQPGRPSGGEALGLRTLFTYLQQRFA
jgi:leucyl aminopeptidase